MPDLETIATLAKRRGFVFPSCEIYGGFGGTWDYGPLGVELKRNIRKAVVARERAVPATIWSAWTPPSSCAAGVGGLRPRRQLHRSAGRLPECRRRFRADQLEGDRVPRLRRRADASRGSST